MHVYCKFYCSPTKKKVSDPHFFWAGDATDGGASTWGCWYSYLSDLCVGTVAVAGCSGLRSEVPNDLVVPGHRTETHRVRSFAVTGPKCLNKSPVGVRDTMSAGPEISARLSQTPIRPVAIGTTRSPWTADLKADRPETAEPLVQKATR